MTEPAEPSPEAAAEPPLSRRAMLAAGIAAPLVGLVELGGSSGAPRREAELLFYQRDLADGADAAGFLTPEALGAAGNGAADDAEAFAAGTPLRLRKKSYLVRDPQAERYLIDGIAGGILHQDVANRAILGQAAGTGTEVGRTILRDVTFGSMPKASGDDFAAVSLTRPSPGSIIYGGLFDGVETGIRVGYAMVEGMPLSHVEGFRAFGPTVLNAKNMGIENTGAAYSAFVAPFVANTGHFAIRFAGWNADEARGGGKRFNRGQQLIGGHFLRTGANSISFQVARFGIVSGTYIEGNRRTAAIRSQATADLVPYSRHVVNATISYDSAAEGISTRQLHGCAVDMLINSAGSRGAHVDGSRHRLALSVSESARTGVEVPGRGNVGLVQTDGNRGPGVSVEGDYNNLVVSSLGDAGGSALLVSGSNNLVNVTELGGSAAQSVRITGNNNVLVGSCERRILVEGSGNVILATAAAATLGGSGNKLFGTVGGDVELAGGGGHVVSATIGGNLRVSSSGNSIGGVVAGDLGGGGDGNQLFARVVGSTRLSGSGNMKPAMVPLA